MGRDDFIVGPANAQALAFLDAWPHWPVASAAIYGPPGSGKTHLASIWRVASGARVVAACEIATNVPPKGPVIVEDIDSAPATPTRDTALFTLLEGARPEAPVLLTAREAPAAWDCTLPDLASRLQALVSLPVWKPDDELLAALARKLLADRQLTVSDAVIARMIRSIERSPDSIREFIARADARALSEMRPVSLALVRAMLAEADERLS